MEAAGTSESTTSGAPAPGVDDSLLSLLHLANRGETRERFLEVADRLFRRRLGADRLDAWLEDGPLQYHCGSCTPGGAGLCLTVLERLPSGDGRLGEVAVEEILGWATPRLDPCEPPTRSPRGSLRGRACEEPPASAPRARGRSPETPPPDACGDERGAPVSFLACRFVIDAENAGILLVRRSGPSPFDSAAADLMEHLADVLGAATAGRRSRAALQERVKELSCLYRIARISSDRERCLDEQLSEIVELLPPSWQYPEATGARLELDGREHATPGYAPGPHRMVAEIRVRGRSRGLVEVSCHLTGKAQEEPRLVPATPFLPEEHSLLEAVAREVSRIVESAESEEERTVLRQQVLHADRLATIGQLSAGVAHELNEPLGNILGFAQLALRSPELAGSVRADLAKIVDASLYARGIIAKLMMFSRSSASRREVLDLDAVVEAGLSMLAPRCERAEIAIQRRRPDTPVPVLGDASQLQQVLVNVAVNAIQAMPDGGRLTVALEVCDGEARLLVEDTGVGISEEVRERIFEPFFTTKDVHEGTGLGLAVVYGIVTAHGGTLGVESEPGRGTTLEVRLPVHLADEQETRTLEQ